MAARKPNPGDKTIRVQFNALDQSQKNKVVGDGVSDILKGWFLISRRHLIQFKHSLRSQQTATGID